MAIQVCTIKHISMFYLELGSEYIVKWISYMKMTVVFFFFFFLGAANML